MRVYRSPRVGMSMISGTLYRPNTGLVGKRLEEGDVVWHLAAGRVTVLQVSAADDRFFVGSGARTVKCDDGGTKSIVDRPLTLAKSRCEYLT